MYSLPTLLPARATTNQVIPGVEAGPAQFCLEACNWNLQVRSVLLFFWRVSFDAL